MYTVDRSATAVKLKVEIFSIVKPLNRFDVYSQIGRGSSKVSAIKLTVVWLMQCNDNSICKNFTTVKIYLHCI